MSMINENTKNLCKMIENLENGLLAEMNNMQALDTEEAYKIIDMIKDLYESKKNVAKSLYYDHIIDAMDNSEYGIDYDENGEIKGYRGRSENTGRYVHRAYRTIGMDPYLRDMDINDKKMYYMDDSGMENVNDRNGYSRGYSAGYAEGQNSKAYESRMDKAIRGYKEAKSTGTDTDKDKENKIKSLTELMHSFEMELLPHIKDMDSNEKQIAKNSLEALRSKIA